MVMSCVQWRSPYVLLACALLSSVVWFAFWAIMAPVEQDIAWIINWYFFSKLGMLRVYNVYGGLAWLHYWAPLTVLSMAILSKLSPWFPVSMSKLSTVTNGIVVFYNTLFLLYLLLAGGKVTTLFVLVLPLRLVLSLGPWIKALLLPHKLFIPLLVATGVQVIFSLCARALTGNKSERTRPYKRLLLTTLPLITLSVLSWFLMTSGCRPCSPWSPLHPRPRLIAHRGCSVDNPENSIAGFERASLLPTMYGFETDVQFSTDGKAFLMHDKNLIRTTNVKEVCPGLNPFINASELAYSGGACPLNKLEIGSSFVEKKLNDEDYKPPAKQRIPLFSDYLRLARDSGKVVVFDLLEPPVGHPLHDSYLNISLSAVRESGIDHHKVWWLAKKDRQWVIENYPEINQITKTIDTPFEDFELEHIKRVNDDWTIPLRTFRTYQDSNISINMYFVDSELMYSYAWCIGVQSVTTDNCQQQDSINHNKLYQVCSDWYNAMYHPWSASWWGGTITLTSLLGLLYFWDKLPWSK